MAPPGPMQVSEGLAAEQRARQACRCCGGRRLSQGFARGQAGQTHSRTGKGARGPGSQPHHSVSLAQTQAQGQREGISLRLQAASLGRSANPHLDLPPGRSPSGSPLPSAWTPRCPGIPGECTVLSGCLGGRKEQGLRLGPRARGSWGKEQALWPLTRQLSTSAAEPSSTGSPALWVWGPGSLSLPLHVAPRGARSTWSMR